MDRVNPDVDLEMLAAIANWERDGGAVIPDEENIQNQEPTGRSQSSNAVKLVISASERDSDAKALDRWSNEGGNCRLDPFSLSD